MDKKSDQKDSKEASKEPPKLPKGAVQLEPGLYVMRDVKSAFAALSCKPTKVDK